MQWPAVRVGGWLLVLEQASGSAMSNQRSDIGPSLSLEYGLVKRQPSRAFACHRERRIVLLKAQ